MSDNKREHTRLPFESTLSIQIDKKETSLEATCLNMSAGGVLVSILAPIAIDTQVNIELKGDRDKFKAQGKIIRLVESSDGYLAAIKYNEIAH